MFQKLTDDIVPRSGGMERKVEIHYQSIVEKAQVLSHPALGLNPDPTTYQLCEMRQASLTSLTLELNIIHKTENNSCLIGLL